MQYGDQLARRMAKALDQGLVLQAVVRLDPRDQPHRTHFRSDYALPLCARTLHSPFTVQGRK